MSPSDHETPIHADACFGFLLDAAPDAIVVTARDGRIVIANAQTEKLFGYAREELVGQKVELLMPQRFRRRHVKNRRAYLSQPAVRPMGLGLELYGRRKDGTEFPVDISISPLEVGREMLVSSAIQRLADDCIVGGLHDRG
jgi:rsbT co-antagonist protein RsbR